MHKPLLAALLLSLSTAAVAEKVWQRQLALPKDPRAPVVTQTQKLDAAGWEQIAGCAQEIAAGRAGQVFVMGCDGGERSAFKTYAFNGQQFVPWVQGGLVQALASDGDALFAIGADRGLWRSGINEPWRAIGTPNNSRITGVAAGRAGLWVLTDQPAGVGGNAVSRSVPCAPKPGQLFGGGHCYWEAEPGALIHLAVGDAAWGIANGGGIYRHDGQNWQQVPGCAVDIAANGGHVYVVGCNPGPGDGHQIYRWNGREFVPTTGAGKRVAVDAAGQPWAITDRLQIWRQRR